MINKVKPTKKQKDTFKHIKRGLVLRDAMLAGGYTEKSATHPKQNLIDTKGFRILTERYREDLKKAGIDSEVLAEIQAEGLFEQNAAIRLDYLKETKKDFGLINDEKTPVTIDAKIIVFNLTNGNNKPNGSISSPTETIESVGDAV